MKLQQLHEAQYDAPDTKKGLDNLMKFFVEEHSHDEVWKVRDNFVVRNTVAEDESPVGAIEFAYEKEADWKDWVLITYMSGGQDDMPIKDMIEQFEVHETRKVY